MPLGGEQVLVHRNYKPGCHIPAADGNYILSRAGWEVEDDACSRWLELVIAEQDGRGAGHRLAFAGWTGSAGARHHAPWTSGSVVRRL